MSKTVGAWRASLPQRQGCWGCGTPWTALRYEPVVSPPPSPQPWAWYCVRCEVSTTKQEEAVPLLPDEGMP